MEAGIPGVGRQPGLHSKLQASLGYMKEGEKRKERERERVLMPLSRVWIQMHTKLGLCLGLIWSMLLLAHIKF